MSILPTINAILNATSACLLVLGYIFIRRKKVLYHKISMLAALGVSCLFLISYLYYHYNYGSTRFTGVGWIRSVYFTILISHTVLAVTILPLIIRTVYLAWEKHFGQHLKIARWTFPLWLYVSVTGVVVYWMLYHL